MDKMDKLLLGIIFPFGVFFCFFFTEIFGPQLSFHLFSAVKSSKVERESAFPNVWGEYKNHSNLGDITK